MLGHDTGKAQVTAGHSLLLPPGLRRTLGKGNTSASHHPFSHHRTYCVQQGTQSGAKTDQTAALWKLAL